MQSAQFQTIQNTKSDKLTRFTDGLDEYYRLKSKYESNIQKDISDIRKKNISKREKASEYKQLVKKCVNCKQAGGTIFGLQNIDDTDRRLLTAKCGNKDTPCSLNIIIYAANYLRIDEYYEELKKTTNEAKNKIICYKNDILFGYKNVDSVSIFEELKDTLAKESDMFQLMEGVLNQRETKFSQQIVKLQTDIYEDIMRVKSIMSEFDQTGTTQFVIDAVTLTLNGIYKKNGDLRKLYYSVMNVEYDDDSYHLIQQRQSIADLEFEYSEPSVIETMVVGVGDKIVKKRSGKTSSKVRRRQPSAKVREEQDTPPDTDSLENQNINGELYGIPKTVYSPAPPQAPMTQAEIDEMFASSPSSEPLRLNPTKESSDDDDDDDDDGDDDNDDANSEL